jgi:hypothetical protein
MLRTSTPIVSRAENVPKTKKTALKNPLTRILADKTNMTPVNSNKKINSVIKTKHKVRKDDVLKKKESLPDIEYMPPPSVPLPFEMPEIMVDHELLTKRGLLYKIDDERTKRLDELRLDTCEFEYEDLGDIDLDLDYINNLNIEMPSLLF